MLRYRIDKRIANTEQWGWTGVSAGSMEQAKELATRVVGGQSTGVKIIDTAAEYGDPRREIVVAGH